MPRALRRLVALAALVTVLPTASACSWVTPELADVTWTGSGFIFEAKSELRRGTSVLVSERIATLTPFAGYVAAPNGTLVYYTVGLGGVGGDCRVPYTLIERWTPDGVENVTHVVPTLPLAVHWPSERGVFWNTTGGATIRHLGTGETLATLMPGQPAGMVEYLGHSTSIRRAAWSADGGKVALVTDDGVWMFRDDGSYLYDSYAQFPAQDALASFSPDGSTLAVGWSQGNGFSEIRLLDLRDAGELRFLAGHRDVRALQALAYGPRGELAAALQEHPLYGGEPSGNASLAFFGAALDPMGEVTWERAFMDRSLAWSPAGDEVAVIVDSKLERVDPRAAMTPDGPVVVVKRDLFPVPAPGLAPLLALALVAALLAGRRR